jgi:hypothetical protein
MSEADSSPLDLPRLLGTLERHGVEYLVCGGSAAVLYGAARPTLDADCVIRRAPENLDRLAVAMRELHARLRVEGMSDEEARSLAVPIDGQMLANMALSTWMTDAGPFDVLNGLAGVNGRTVPYEELAERAVTVLVSGVTVRAAALDDIITAKEHADRDKDREALPELRNIRDTSTAPTGPEQTSQPAASVGDLLDISAPPAPHGELPPHPAGPTPSPPQRGHHPSAGQDIEWP